MIRVLQIAFSSHICPQWELFIHVVFLTPNRKTPNSINLKTFLNWPPSSGHGNFRKSTYVLTINIRMFNFTVFDFRMVLLLFYC